MKLKKLLPAVLMAMVLLTACGRQEPVDDWEPPTKATEQPQPTQPDPTQPDPEPTVPTDPEPTVPAPSQPDPEPVEPTEPEVEFNPGQEEHVHRFGKWTITQQASCTRIGRKVRYCSCGEEEIKTYINDHQYGQWTARTEATCTEPGEDVRYCATCGVEDKTISPKLGHDEVITPGIPATCTTDGVADLIQCARCNELLQDATVIEAAHTMVIVESIAPACGVEGRTQSSYCEVCQEVFEESQVIPALKHSPESWFEQNPTCTDFGMSEMDTCTYCGIVLEMPEIYDRLGHDLADGVCTRCGHTCDHGVDPENPGQIGALEKENGVPQSIIGNEYLYHEVVCEQCGQTSQIVVVNLPEQAPEGNVPPEED